MGFREVVINGKFLLASLEGMPRTGREITAALDGLIEEGLVPDLKIKVLAPKGAAATITLRHIPVEEVGVGDGPVWEQVEFPLYAKGRYTINYTSTAPVVTKFGCVVVHDAQVLSARKSHGWKSKLLYGTITPMVAQRYKAVVTPSHYAKEEILKYAVCERDDLEVVHNGSDHVLRVKPDESTLGWAGLEEGEYILSISATHHHKNLRTVFNALKGHPELCRRLVLAGSATPDHYAAMGIELPEGVRTLGRVSDERLVELMRKARMFVFPSMTEGFGLPPLEAMTLGCPTIVSRAGAMPEVCGDGAWYADSLEQGQWLEQIARLWDDVGARLELAGKGQERAKQFTWRKAALRYLEVIRRSLET